MYPQLEEQKLESAFWVHFTRRLLDHPAAAELGEDFVQNCVLQAVNNLPALPTTQGEDEYRRIQHRPATALITDVLKLCVETRNGNFCVRVLDNMKQAARTGTFSAECPPWGFYLELTRSVDGYLPTLDDASQLLLQPFFKEAAVWILSGSSKHGQPPFSPCPFTEENLATLAVAIRRGGDFSFLESYVSLFGSINTSD